ncbi:uncharacterized protein LOC101302005 [Anopheles sinensis]|uniref:Uncharacterized protein LOC101302005 n=1 Tax=Anopheles sinensis TaxID=74873 RepID=A0A084WF48_ANOSI|nr:uncharacterized protein LOC101302005 [Anopheles sinensis]
MQTPSEIGDSCRRHCLAANAFRRVACMHACSHACVQLPIRAAFRVHSARADAEFRPSIFNIKKRRHRNPGIRDRLAQRSAEKYRFSPWSQASPLLGCALSLRSHRFGQNHHPPARASGEEGPTERGGRIFTT